MSFIIIKLWTDDFYYVLQVWIHLYLPLSRGTFSDELSERVPLMRRWEPYVSRSSHEHQALRVRKNDQWCPT